MATMGSVCAGVDPGKATLNRGHPLPSHRSLSRHGEHRAQEAGEKNAQSGVDWVSLPLKCELKEPPLSAHRLFKGL